MVLKLDERFNKMKKSKEISSSVAATELEIVKLKSAFDFKICEDENLNVYLNNRSNELYSNEVNSSLKSGKILCEVFEKLGGNNRHDGLYNSWLEVMQYNARTALRHRIRYNLFETSTTENAKELFATLPIRLLDKLNVHNERDHFISLINNSDIKSKDELASFMENEQIKEVNEEIKPTISFYKPVFTFEKTLKKMDVIESRKAFKELEEVEKEVKRLKKIIKQKEEDAAL